MKMWLMLLVLLIPQGEKLAVPAPEALKKNEKIIRDLLKDGYQKKDQNARRLLARSLIEAAEKEVNDWTMVYSFYREAADVAADAMDFETAVGAIAQIEKIFKVEPDSPLTGATFSARHELRKYLFKRTQKAVQTVDDAMSFIKAALKLADLYYAEDGFDDGLTLSQMAEGVAQASGDKGLQMLSHGYVRKYSSLKSAHDKVSKAHLRALSDPMDAEASQAWGLFLAFVKQDWEQAAPWLLRGKDGMLKDVIRKETEKTPDAALADAWLGLADKAKEPDKGQYRIRALYWLEKSAGTAVGVEKLKAEKKLEELNKALGITDLLKIVDPMKDFFSKGKTGSAKVDGSKLIVEGTTFEMGLLEFQYIPPPEYTLTIIARHAGGAFLPFRVGLTNGDHQWAVVAGLTNVTLGASPGIQNVDGKFFSLDDDSKNAASARLGAAATYIFTVRPSGFTLAVNGRDVIDWSGDAKRLSAPDLLAVSHKNTIFFGSSSRYEILKAVVNPISGHGQKLR